MQSDERILTTHCGSLPRPPALSELLLKLEAGEPIDQRRLHQESSEAVAPEPEPTLPAVPAQETEPAQPEPAAGLAQADIAVAPPPEPKAGGGA